jgi:excisionase family DNA binding protein
MLLKVRDVAEQLNCSISTVYQLVELGELGSFQIGARRGGIRISDEQIKEYLTRCQRSVVAGKGSHGQTHLKHIRVR